MGMGALRRSERPKSSDYGTLRQVERSTPSYAPSYGSVRAAERSAPATPTPTPSYTPSDMAAYSNSSLNSRFVSAPTPTMASVRSYGAPQVNTARDAGASAGTPTYRGTSNPSSGYVSSGSRDAGASSGPSTTMANVRSSGSPAAIGPLFPSAITPGQKMANVAYQQGQNPFLATAGGMARDVVEATGAGKLLQLGGKAIAPLLPTVQQAAARFYPTVQQNVQQAANRISEIPYRYGPQLSQVSRTLGSGLGGPGRPGPADPLANTLLKSTLAPAGVAGAGLGLSWMLTPTSPPQGPGSPVEPKQVPTQVDPITEGSLRNLKPTYDFRGGTYGGGMTPMTPSMSAETGITDMTGRIVPGPGVGQQQPAQQFTQQFEQRPEQQFEQQLELPKVEQMQIPENLFNPQAVMQQLDQVLGQMNQQNAALIAQITERFTAQIDAVEAQLRQQYQQQGTTIDPATMSALKEIRDEVNRRRQQLMEEMNRRGLLQSGIWLEQENRILSNQLTTEEKLLAGRVADIQNRMTDALMKLGQQRINTMGDIAQNQMQSQQWMQGQQIDAMNRLSTRNDQWNQWWQEQLAQQKRDTESKRRFDIEQEQERAKTLAGWTGTIPQGYPGAGQQTLDARKAETQASRKLYSDSATNSYIKQIETYPDIQTALNDFQRYRAEMEGKRANTDQVLQAIYSYFGGN